MQTKSRSSNPVLIGLDMGSTNIKAVAYEPDGRTVAIASAPTITHYPRPSWAYYEPDELWSSAVQVLREVTSKLDDPRRVAGLAVASVGEAGVTLDAEGEPTYQCIAWFDRRTIPQMEWLKKAIGEDALFATTGLALEPIFSLCKLLWLKENEPDAFQRATRWLNVADFIAFRLSGAAATDWSLASRTMMFDIRRLDWATAILTDAGIPTSLPAPAVASGTPIGRVSSEMANLTGLPAGAVVAAGGQDHVCGALAAGVVTPGSVCDSMGTAEALFVALDQPSADPTLGRQGYTQGAHVAPGHYYVFGGLYTSGASIEWLRDLLGRDVPLSQLLADAAQVPAGSIGSVFLPHLRLGNAPNPDPRSRGALIGLTTDTTPAAVTRAILEGLAFEARNTVDPLLTYAGARQPHDVRLIGGGARNELLVRIKASVMNANMRVLDLDEATALGAAILGGIGAGVYTDIADALGTIRSSPKVISPTAADVPVYETYFHQVYRPLYAALRDLNHRLYTLSTAGGRDDAPERHG
jgi:xylulokinase